MKIRISEAQLRQIIRESMFEDDGPAVEKTKKKVVNKTKNTGDFEQIYKGDPFSYGKVIPGFVVVVSNVKNETVANVLQRMIGLSPVGDYYINLIKESPELSRFFIHTWENDGNGNPMRNEGFKLYRNLLDGTFNQIYGSQIEADRTDDTSKVPVDKDPIDHNYGIINGNPFTLDNGLAVAKDEDFVSQYFYRYTKKDAVFWDLATYHKDGRYIFFFWDLGTRNTFVKQLKNCFMIANHSLKRGQFQYSFISEFNPQIQIAQFGGGTEDDLQYTDPRSFLNDEDDDLLAIISKLIESQQEDEAQRQLELTPEYIAQKKAEEAEKRRRDALSVIAANMPASIRYDNPAVSAPQRIGGTGTVDGLDESKLDRIIRESIRKTLKRY